MSKEFYNYLTKKITAYFENKSNFVGERYGIYFENEQEVHELLIALSELDIAKKFIWVENGELIYETYYLDLNNKKLIIAATINNVQPDFLTTLRNNVGTNKEEFREAGILIIYNTRLDSITNGTESFQREGMPFHIDNIINDIKKIKDKSNLSSVDKAIVEFDLERRKQDVFKDNTSIFEYKDILAVINSGRIEREDYKNFRLLYDEEIQDLTNSRKILKELKENNEIFEKIDYSHRYGSVEADLDNIIEDDLINKCKKEDWETAITYPEVKESINNINDIKPMKLIDFSILANGVELLENHDYFIKDEGTSKVKQRNKHILIFNSNKNIKFEIQIGFNKHLSMHNDVKSINSTINYGGKKVNAVLFHSNDNVTFDSITLKDSEVNAKFKFNLCIIDLDFKYFEKVISDILVNPNKKKDKCYIEFTGGDDFILLNETGDNEVEIYLEKGGSYQSSKEDKIKLLKNNDLFSEEDNKVYINLKVDEFEIPIAIMDESRKPNIIYGLSVWKQKRERKCSFIYTGENRLQQGANEYFARDDFRYNLELETKLIESGAFYWELSEGNLHAEDLELDDRIRETYLDLISYFKVKNLIPSLAYYDDELTVLANKYITSVLEIMREIEEDKSLHRLQKNIVKIGTIRKNDGEGEILYTPLSPLNLTYQLTLDSILDSEQFKDDDHLIKKINSLYLLPYITDERKQLYRPIEQGHSPEWTYYVKAETKRYKGSREFVSKLVKEKIEEFISHFSYLFMDISDATLKINLINTGDCREILQGIFSYYLDQLKDDKTIDDLNPIEVNIYSSRDITHSFNEFANYESIEDIKRDFNLNLENKKYSASDIINAFRDRVRFYDKSEKDKVYAYAHITFYEMNQNAATGNSNMNEIFSGISLDGLISGVPSVTYGDSYRTGFGTKYANVEKSPLVELATKLNAIARVANISDPFDSNKCITTEIEKRDEEKLDKIYNSSNWVTFIEPKVDLNFFKSDEKSKDLLIIHYSDQYTSTSGYDAITVTRKSEQYSSIIEEYLTTKNVHDANKHIVSIINMFNAVNGDWLLRLISSKSHFDREKISILSAIKLSLAYFNHKNIIWVPISMEEILRVSGGAGLKKSEGFFSAKNLGFENNGVTSDDIMLIGIEQSNESDIRVHCHPIEVKIGRNEADYIEKGVEQVKKTKELVMSILMPENEEKVSFKTKIYRNFFMQLAIISAEKLKMYGIWPDQDWDIIIDSDIRRKLLNEEYEISQELEQYLGKGAVVSFKKNSNFRKIYEKEGIPVIEFTEEDGINFITRSISEILDDIINNYTDIDKTKLLHNIYTVSNDKPETSGGGNNGGVVTVPGGGEQGDGGTSDGNDDDPIVEDNRPMQILFGTNQSNNQELHWYPNDTSKVFHTNTGIIGTMGTGKTQFTKSIITQLYRESKYNLDNKGIGILIFDYKGDYNKTKQDFLEATDAKVYELFHLPFNPLSVVRNPNSKPMLPLHIANTLKETLAKAFGLGIKQETLLRELFMEAYEKRGIVKSNPETWDKPAPTLSDVYNIYINREDLKEDSLYAAFSNLIDFEIFEPDPFKTKSLFDIIQGVTVIDLSGYDEGIQNLVVAITLDLFYSQMHAAGHSKIEGNLRQLSKLVLVDEADNFLSKDFGALKKILKEGREFGVGTILSTQLLSHFSTGENEYANYILTWVVHNVSDLNPKDVKYIFNTQTNSEQEEIYNKIKALNKHYSLVKMGNVNKPIYIRDKAFWELNK